MAELAFRITHAESVAFAASPQIALHVEIRTARPGLTVQSVLLRSTVRIDAASRGHDRAERARLAEVFGEGDVWVRSSKSLLWANVVTVVSGFEGVTVAPLSVPCTYDLTAAAARYLQGVTGGDVPLTVQFGGTVFQSSPEGLQITQIPWDREASFRMPHALFRHAMDEHFPNSAVVSVRQDLFERLEQYRREHGLVRTDDALERLLSSAAERGAA